MGYWLGIDLGTTYTAAAVYRDGRAEIATLGTRAAAVPSVLHLGPDGTVLTGEAALRRAVAEPDRIAREFKRRVGDPTPLFVGGSPYSAEALAAKLLRWVVDSVTEREGGPPERIAVTHPASWGPYKKDLFVQAVRMADLDRVTMLTEPEAAALSYASAERVEVGSVVAVYDLGGGTFDAAVLRKTPQGRFELLGTPEGIERLGGIDFDETVFAHVARSLGGALEELDPTDPVTLTAVARLRQECVDAKEALSSDTDVTIPVLLPERRTQVRLVRSEFEAMIRPALEETIAALGRALASAAVTPERLTAVLLVGGSSRIPLVAQMVSGSLGRPVAVDADPKHAIALGAAMAAANVTGIAARPVSTAPMTPPAVAAAAGPAAAVAPTAAAVAPTELVAPPRSAPPQPPPARPSPARPSTAPLPAQPTPVAAASVPPPRPAVPEWDGGRGVGSLPGADPSPSRRIALLATGIIAAIAVLAFIGFALAQTMNDDPAAVETADPSEVDIVLNEVPPEPPASDPPSAPPPDDSAQTPSQPAPQPNPAPITPTPTPVPNPIPETSTAQSG